MEKRMWLLVPFMVIFWVGNWVVSSYCLAHLAWPQIALILVLFSHVLDWILAGFMSSRSKVNSETSLWGSTAVFYLWLITTFLNTVLVGMAAFIFLHLIWEIAVLIGFIYLVIRGFLFVFAPVFLCLD